MMFEIMIFMVCDFCDCIVECGGCVMVVQVCEIISSVYWYVNDCGYGLFNLVVDIKFLVIVMFKLCDCCLQLEEIGVLFRFFDIVSILLILKLVVKFILIMMVCKIEFIMVMWKEVDFSKGIWMILFDRMKGSWLYVIYFLYQVQDLMVGLQMCVGGSDYLLSGCYSISKLLFNVVFNLVIDCVVVVVVDVGENL